MSRRAFTLIELMVSITLTVIVVLFLYKALSNQEIANATLTKNAGEIERKAKLYELLFRDLSQASQVRVEPVFNKNYKILFLKTTNSIHEIPEPYVAYFVYDTNRTLVRLESAYPLKFPVELEKIKYIFADPLVSQVDSFLVYEMGSEGGRGVVRRELLPGERPQSKKESNLSKEYFLYLHWPEGKIVMDMKK